MIYLNLEGCLGILKCLQLDLIFFPAWKWNSAFPSAVFLFFTDNTKNNTLPNGTVHMFYLFFTFHGINLLPFIVGRSYYWYMPNYVMRPYICIASPPPHLFALIHDSLVYLLFLILYLLSIYIMCIVHVRRRLFISCNNLCPIYYCNKILLYSNKIW